MLLRAAIPLNKGMGKAKAGGNMPSKGKMGGKSAMLAALGGVGKPEVYELPAKKEPKSSMLEPSSNYWPPTLYLSEKDFPGVYDFRAGDTRTLVITCDVKSKSMDEDEDGKEHHNSSLVITAISDITGAKIKG